MDAISRRNSWCHSSAATRRRQPFHEFPPLRKRYAQLGVKDYWASPAEFLARAAGDCEDFVIAKYLSLTALGWNEDQLRFVAVKDLRTGMDHAILVAFHNGQALVLDNNSQSIKYAEELSYYRPIYSINSTSWWLHRAGFPGLRL